MKSAFLVEIGALCRPLFGCRARLHSHASQCAPLHPEPAVQRAGKDRACQQGRVAEAAYARAEPIAVPVTDNYLQTWPEDRMSTVGADFAGPRQNPRSGSYLDGGPSGASESE
jgi:hypothetical protein